MFAGLLSKNRDPSSWGGFHKIMDKLAPYRLDAARDVWVSDRMVLMNVATQRGLKSADIYQHHASGVVVAFWGRLDNRSELIVLLEVDHTVSDDELICLAWLKWGKLCPEKLVGDFSFAVASPRDGTVFLARDVMGVKPLFYRIDDNGVFFSNNVASFHVLRLGTVTRSQEWLAKYLVNHSQSHTQTAYNEIKKLPGGHSLLIRADGSFSIRRYHTFIDNAPIESVRNKKWLEIYKSVWTEAVACRLPAAGAIGSENSGGIDSAGITSEIARQLGLGIDRLHGLGFCVDALEPEYIMATAMHWHMKHNHLFSHSSSEQWSSMRHRGTRCLGYPNEHINGQSHIPLYETCAKFDIGTLFSGFGGDEAVTYPVGMPARIELLDQGNFGALWKMLPGAWPVRAARFAKAALYALNPPRINRGMMSVWNERWQFRPVTDDAVREFSLDELYFASATYDEGFRKTHDAAIYLLGRSYVPTRLEVCTLNAANYGIEYVWPLLDQRLIQQWLSIPSIWKTGDAGLGRYLHRRAIDQVCPDKVVWKMEKSMCTPGVSDRRSMEREIAELLPKLYERASSLPSELAVLVDSNRLRNIAEKGMRENNLRGTDVWIALTECLDVLDSADDWLSFETSK